MRWGELVALRSDDPASTSPWTTAPCAERGGRGSPRAISDPRRTGRGVEKGPKTEAGKHVIALDQETVQAFLAHWELVGGPYDHIFTSPGGSRGPSGVLAHNNFIRVWKRAQRVPMIAVAGRLGHANAVVTMMVYAHVDKLVDRGPLTADELRTGHAHASGGRGTAASGRLAAAA